jgi:hypothetical protein
LAFFVRLQNFFESSTSGSMPLSKVSHQTIQADALFLKLNQSAPGIPSSASA